LVDEMLEARLALRVAALSVTAELSDSTVSPDDEGMVMKASTSTEPWVRMISIHSVPTPPGRMLANSVLATALNSLAAVSSEVRPL